MSKSTERDKRQAALDALIRRAAGVQELLTHAREIRESDKVIRDLEKRVRRTDRLIAKAARKLRPLDRV